MCVRTKTSYGCGCEYKTTADCNLSYCLGLERYHYPRNGDCRSCKEAGSAITRGRDGRGRYGQELSRRSHFREEAKPSADLLPPSTADIGKGISPWSDPSIREKDWQTHSRKKADDAWLHEHAERNFDLQSIRDSLPPYPPSDRDSPIDCSPRRREARIYVLEEDSRLEYAASPEQYNQREDPGKSLPVEIRSTHDNHDRPSRHRICRRRRQDSQESFESTPSSRSSAHKYTPTPISCTAHEYGDLNDSGYGSYGSRASNGYGLTKTEPYLYPPSPPTRPMSIKSPSSQSHGYHTGFGIGPVSLAARAPMYSYSSRRY